MSDEIRNNKYNRWLIFSVTALGTVMATLDASIVNVALPVIAQTLGIDLPMVQWVVSAYLLTISSLLPLFGKLGDMYGRRKIYLAGLLVFVLGSLFCAISLQIWVLILSRVIQGVGAAMLMANSPAILSVTFSGKERGRALGMNGTVVALGSMTGPSLGGLLVGVLNWQVIFYINIPIGIMAAILGYLILPREEQQKSASFDYFGAVLFALSMTGILLVLSHGQEWGWSSPATKAIFISSFIAFCFFIWREMRVDNPMIEISMFKNWPLLSGNIAGLFSFMAVFSNNIMLPFYLHNILSLSPTQIGIAITPFPLLLAVTAPISGFLSEKINPAILTTSGLVVTGIGLSYLAMLSTNASIWHVMLGQGIMGIGNGMFQSPNNNSILSSVDKEKVGLVSGMNALVRNVGMVSGVAMAVSVFETRKQYLASGLDVGDIAGQTASFLGAYQTTLLVAAFLAGLGALISLGRKRSLEQKA